MIDDYTLEKNWDKPIRRKKVYLQFDFFGIDTDKEYLEEIISKEQKPINKNYQKKVKSKKKQ